MDVLLGSHHCAGAANIAAALAAVAGIPARRISTSTHSTVEFFIDGQWCWCDNIRGGALLHPGSYQQFLSNLAHWPHVTQEQYDQHKRDEVFYRSPYEYGATLWWRFGGGDIPQDAIKDAEGDAARGIGISVHYDPATASALYPDQNEYIFHADAAEQPWLTIGAKNSWFHAYVDLDAETKIRRQVYCSESGDNPIIAAELCVWCDGDGSSIEVLFDGIAVPFVEMRSYRGVHQVAVFAVDPTLLTAGWHDVVVSGGRVGCFPDIVEGHEAGCSSEAVRITPDMVQTDPVVFLMVIRQRRRAHWMVSIR